MSYAGRRLHIRGESNNPLGSPRVRLTTMAIEAFANDFEKHGVQAIIDVREKDPGLYLRYIMQMIPLQVYLGEDESPGDHRKLLNAVEAKMTNQGKKLLELRTDNGSR